MIFQWIKNYLSDIKTTWMLVRYKRRDEYLWNQDLRAQSRVQIWHQDRVVQDASSELFPQSDDEDDGYEYSNGNTGYRIKRKVDAGGKSLGLYTRWDLFYIGMKERDATPYASFIYLSGDGVSKHDGNVEVIGVDLCE